MIGAEEVRLVIKYLIDILTEVLWFLSGTAKTPLLPQFFIIPVKRQIQLSKKNKAPNHIVRSFILFCADCTDNSVLKAEKEYCLDKTFSKHKSFINQKTVLYFGRFSCGGGAGSRTPVQSTVSGAFYMLILRLIVSHFGTWANLGLTSP